MAGVPRVRDKLPDRRGRLACPPRSLRAPAVRRPRSDAAQHPVAPRGLVAAVSHRTDGGSASAVGGRRGAAVVVYGATAVVIELLLAAAWRYAAARSELLDDAEPSRPTSPDRRRGLVGVVLYGGAIVIGVVLDPRLAAFATSPSRP